MIGAVLTDKPELSAALTFEHPRLCAFGKIERLRCGSDLNKRHRTSLDKKELLTQTGLLQMGSQGSDVIQGGGGQC